MADQTLNLARYLLLTPFIAALLIPAVGTLGAKVRNTFAVLAALLTALFAVKLAPALLGHVAASAPGKAPLLIAGVYDWMPGLARYDMLVDGLSLSVTLVAGLIGALIVIYSLGYMAHDEGQTRYYALVLLFIGGMIGMTLSDSLLFLFFFWEVIGVCSYALIGFYHKDPKAAAAGMKAFLTTKVGDFALLGGILLLYWDGPRTFSLAVITQSQHLYSDATLSLAAFLFLAGAVGKSAQVPLHVWLPDAMEAPSTISALIHAATLVNSGVYLIARMTPVFLDTVDGFSAAVTTVGALTAFLAATLAVVEADLKRILAYSTVSQLGYMMFALGSGALFAAQFHLVSHAIFKALLFLSAGAIIHTLHTRNMYEMGGLAKAMPVIHGCMATGLLSLAGVPVLGGFWSKDLILANAFANGHGFLPRLPFVLAVLAAVLTAAYSTKIYLLLFAGERKGARAHGKGHGHDHDLHLPGPVMTVPLVILAFATCVSWFPVGRLSRLLVDTVHLARPFEAFGVKALVLHTLHSPIAYLALACVALGYWLARHRRGAGLTGDHWRLATWSLRLPKRVDRAQVYLMFRRAFGFDRLVMLATGALRIDQVIWAPVAETHLG